MCRSNGKHIFTILKPQSINKLINLNIKKLIGSTAEFLQEFLPVVLWSIHIRMDGRQSQFHTIHTNKGSKHMDVKVVGQKKTI